MALFMSRVERISCLPKNGPGTSNRIIGQKTLIVGSSHPGAVVGPKGMAVRHLKWYVSWV